ncbi:hypothetical protein [Lyngbya sp. PCC 8106]|uniref:hypothetical protein n=1 Tax=Lyngbya sp. (strain PCC 8106) TaxID=313612 RepID=UPI0002EE0740|nr:hypothetical protein [Lyngbya sp. PCC 8106]
MSSLITIALLALYAGGVWKFWSGFEQTNFVKSFGNRLYLSLLWPVFLPTNRSYRKNFTKALKGSKR